jgi:hypothetical protein
MPKQQNMKATGDLKKRIWWFLLDAPNATRIAGVGVNNPIHE